MIQESGMYQLGVPQGQGDSSALNTTDPIDLRFLSGNNSQHKSTDRHGVFIELLAADYNNIINWYWNMSVHTRLP